MPTRIVMANGEHISVSESPDVVADQLNSGNLTRLDRPWGDTAIYVNASAIAYLEAQDDRAPNIEAMEAVAESGAVGGPAGGAGGGGAVGGPTGGRPPGAPHPGGPPNPP